MSTHVLLNLIKELRKSEKIRGLPSIYVFFATNKFNNTKEQMLDSISYDFKIIL